MRNMGNEIAKQPTTRVSKLAKAIAALFKKRKPAAVDAFEKSCEEYRNKMRSKTRFVQHTIFPVPAPTESNPGEWKTIKVKH